MRLRALLAVPLLLSLATPLVPAVAAPAADGPTWADAGVPYADPEAGVLRFGGGSIAVVRELTSVAASTEAAYVLDGHRLTVVPADGGPDVVVDRHVVGLPIADPVGHLGVWTTRTDAGLRLRGYDDRTATVVRGPRVDGARVVAVDGRAAFVSDVYSGETRRWPVGHPLGRVLPDLVTDAHDGLRVELRHGTGEVVVAKGRAIRDHLGRFALGTFSPDGRHVSLWARKAVYDLDSHARVKLTGLGPNDLVSARWTPSGDLVVAMGRLYDRYDDANPLRRYLCDVGSGTCAALPGAARLGDEPTFESNAGGVFVEAGAFS